MFEITGTRSSLLFALCSLLFALCSLLCTLFSVLCTLFSVLYPLCFFSQIFQICNPLKINAC